MINSDGYFSFNFWALQGGTDGVEGSSILRCLLTDLQVGHTTVVEQSE
jgi:hypothetical protein